MGTVMDDAEKYGRAVDAGEMTFQEAVSVLVEAHPNALAPLGAADLLANWKSAQASDGEGNAEVPPEDPAEYLAFAVKNGIIPARLQPPGPQD